MKALFLVISAQLTLILFPDVGGVGVGAVGVVSLGCRGRQGGVHHGTVPVQVSGRGRR